MKKIQPVEIFEYQGYTGLPPKDSPYKNELWVQLKLLQDKMNELVRVLNSIQDAEGGKTWDKKAKKQKKIEGLIPMVKPAPQPKMSRETYERLKKAGAVMCPWELWHEESTRRKNE